MAESILQRISRRWLIIGGAAIAAIAVFGGGALAGQALTDDEPQQVTRLSLGASGAGANGNAAEELSGRDSGGGWSPASLDSMRYGFCPAPLPAGAGGPTIDPSAAGIDARLLGEGFTLSAITLRGEGDCDENGQATNVRPVLESTWIHAGTGMSVWVIQRPSDVPVANYIDEWSAIVYSDGYIFNVSAGGWAMPLTEPVADSDTAVSSEMQTAEEARAVVLAALAQIAPEVPEQCFYRVVPGTWEDIAALGLADPRSAIPAGFTEQYSSIRLLEEPGASCDQPLLEGYYGSGVDASFTDASGAWIGISAYRIGDTDEFYAGSSNEYGISWSDGVWQFNVYGNAADGSGLGLEVLTPIAEAFAPTFSEECLAVDRELTAEELEAAGFNQPVVPEGYALESTSWMVNEIPAECAEVPENVTASGYGLGWVFTNGAEGVIEIYVSRSDLSTPSSGPGQINDAGLTWVGPEGTLFSVYHYAPEGTMLDREALIAIGQSLDPTLDPSTLVESEDVPKPLPAPDQVAEDVAAAAEARARELEAAGE